MIEKSINDKLVDAVNSKDLEGLIRCLDAGADPNFWSREPHSSPPMLMAAEDGFIKGMEALYLAGGDVNVRGHGGNRPLMQAIRAGEMEAFHWLLRHGADERLESDVAGKSPLQVALINGFLDDADLLLQERPRCRGQYLDAVARIIIGREKLAVTEWLLQKGVSPNIATVDGDSWLIVTQTQKDHNAVRITEVLVAAGADINAQGSCGTALHKALAHQSLRSFLALLRAGADPDIPNDDRWSVRVLMCRESSGEFSNAFKAWEASRAVDGVIHKSHDLSSLRPL